MEATNVSAAMPHPPRFGYVALYRGKRIEVYAPTAYEAAKVAAAKFGARKSYEVTVVLCEDADGKPVVHSTGGL